jgi:general secretion pathway protein D
VNGADSRGSPIGGTNFNNTGTSASSIIAGVLSNTLPALGNGLSLGGGSITDDGKINWGLVIQALAADTDTNILSTPSLLTLDNEEAEIIVGQNVPFVTGSFTNTGGAGTSVDPFQTIQREDVGITLKVKPQINEGNAIVLEIEQETSSISESASAADIITDKRSIKTNVLVEDGHVVVLGGLIEDRVSETEQKVPLLGDLPVLGALFRSKGTNHDKQNLMVFIRPAILRDSGVSDSYTSRKYNLLRARQFELHGPGVPLLPGAEIPRLPAFEDLLELPPPFEAEPDVSPTGGDQDG